ncbi:Multiple resistance and pH homeostasis protein D [Trueperella pyogenes]|uniref:Na+/H+ antiporter subunit D n=1 Tax=Trueperella pyogenes TaxID=1661 RepID=UPI000DFB9F6C|nr:Na+/H+ antiporter subunit D [Trueperella pyogenes]MBB3025353.1 multicomponent Na+:H+ antiporter subunit D [Trueperella pyogenes]SUO88102.1 Multiple resistance and pH homeostasis protein D [Trueperella pyogenes]
MTWDFLVALPVVLPIFGAGLSLAFASVRRLQAIVSASILFLVWVVAGALVFMATSGPLVLDVANWAAPVGITLVADRLSAMMLFTSVTVTLTVLLYSLAQGAADGDDAAPIAVYHPAFLLLSAGVSNAFLSGDLFNIYVGFELLLTASFVLITLGGTRDRIRSGTVYVVVSLISSVVFLIAIALTYAAAGTVSLAQLALRLPEIDPGMRITIQVMLLVGFGIKAAVFPLSAWLPDSYPTAPAPVTAVFAGLLTKVGVYAIIRTQTLLFPYNRLTVVIGAVAICTMLMGILGAVAQQDIKRLLSFTLVSHIGFMIWGISLYSVHGLGATIYYAVHHITVQTALFLVVGLIERRGGTTSLVRLGSLAKFSPIIAALYVIPALNLAGIPPGSGFFGKVGLIQASVDRGAWIDWMLVATGIICSLLTLYAVSRAWNMAFWQAAPEPLPAKPIPWGMRSAAGALVVFSLVISFWAGPIYRFTEGAATELRARSPYIVAVLPEDGRGTGQSTKAPGATVPTVKPTERVAPGQPLPAKGDERD